ncbi:hypothetical protein [Nannocystis pusilla]|uniref:hypothetical protein n=1 Tax=Nannocystis pusilla TaxID=889268 RepID=UPI003B8046A2
MSRETASLSHCHVSRDRLASVRRPVSKDSPAPARRHVARNSRAPPDAAGPQRPPAPPPRSRSPTSARGSLPSGPASPVAGPRGRPVPEDSLSRARHPPCLRAAAVPRDIRARPARDDLALEVGLLDRARARLDARDPAGAAQLLDAHARQFPRGALVDAREAAAVELLCLQGRPTDAATAAQRLAARLPDSVLARRFERFVCPDDDEPR